MERQPLIVGVTGHWGAGRSTVATMIASKFDFGVISMSGLIDASEDRHTRVSDLQTRGDELRDQGGPEAIAQLAVEKMASERRGWVVDGIKNPAEAHLLASSGEFYMLGVQASVEERWRRTRKILASDRNKFDGINARDDEEKDDVGLPIAHGQRVGDCLALADAHIWNDAPMRCAAPAQKGTLEELEQKATRFCETIMSPGAILPTDIEVRMCQAYAVARRSPCARRKVGAVITNDSGRIIAEGWNDVPEGHPACTSRHGECYRQVLRKEYLSELANLFMCPRCGGALSEAVECTVCGGKYSHVVPTPHNLDLCRALHAEERAILQVSKHGGIGIAGGTIFTTTFPCALCAKKIVGCDIRAVIFAEPYDVPEALEFFEDANTELFSFEGFSYRSFHRVFG